MATTLDFVEFVCEQTRGVGEISYKKMFGEYMVYVNAKPILLVCDNTVYVKMHEEVSSLLAEADSGNPFEGAKKHYILDIDNTELSQAVAEILERVTPIPIKKIKKEKKS